MHLNRIVIVGYYNRNNLGDELFKIILEKIIHCNNNIVNVINIEQLNYYSNKIDVLIVGGGEIGDQYFLNPINKYKINNPSVVIIGVSVGFGFESIIYNGYIDCFDHMIVRNRYDYNLIKERLGEKYVTYLPDLVFYELPRRKDITNTKKIKIGIFPSSLSNKHSQVVNTLANLIKSSPDLMFHFYLFCTNQTESDTVLIDKLSDKLSSSQITSTIINVNNYKIIEHVDIGICYRYHSHIICTLYGIPFISLTDIPKVNKFINDLNIPSIKYCHIPIYNQSTDLIKDKIKYIQNNYENISNELYTRGLSFHNDALNYIHEIDNAIIHKHRKTFPYVINISDTMNTIISNIGEIKFPLSGVAADRLTKKILYQLDGFNDSTYYLGLYNKLVQGRRIFISDEIYWLINKCIKTRNPMFYYKYGLISPNKHRFNICYINQLSINPNQRTSVHRSGLDYIVKNILESGMNDNNASTLFDFSVDRTFGWKCNELYEIGILPYKKDWIGIIHHTDLKTYRYNLSELLDNNTFIESLNCCKLLIVLSDNLRYILTEKLKKRNIKIPAIISLTHPTEFIDNTFHIKNFISNKNKKLLHIGAWLRDMSAIYNLHLYNNENKIEKYIIEGLAMENYFMQQPNEYIICPSVICSPNICCSSDNGDNSGKMSVDHAINNLNDNYKSVKRIKYVDNLTYDALLSENIVFIKLLDAAAVNTVIECCVRNTPIVINRLPAIVEILGESYPLYYKDLTEAALLISDINKIHAAFIYLSAMEKKKLSIDYFIESLIANLPV